MKKMLIYTIIAFSFGCYVGGGHIPVGSQFIVAYIVALISGVKATRWFYQWKANDFVLFGYKLGLTFTKAGKPKPKRVVNTKQSTKAQECTICNGEDVTLNGQVIPCPVCKPGELVKEDKVVPIKRNRKAH